MFKLIFSAIGHFFAFAFKFVYSVLKAFKVRLLALWLLVSVILALCGVFKRVGLWLFWTGCGVCLFFTLVAWGVAVYSLFKRKSVPRKQEESEEQEEKDEKEKSEEPAREEQREERQKEPSAPARIRYPVWFDVQGNPDYCFAEYADRYELYYRGKEGLERVRVDYKGDIK